MSITGGRLKYITIFGTKSSNSAGIGVEGQLYISFNSNFTELKYKADYKARTFGPFGFDCEIIQAYMSVSVNDVEIASENEYNIGTGSGLGIVTKSFESTKSISGISIDLNYVKVSAYIKCWGGTNSRDVQITEETSLLTFWVPIKSSISIIKSTEERIYYLPTGEPDTTLYFIKNMTGTNKNIMVSHDCNLDDGVNYITISNKQAAVLFRSSPTNWYIANLFNGSMATTTYATTEINKIGYAIAGKVNVFSVNDKPYPTNISDRTSGDNHCKLPVPVSGSICIVVYAGNASSKNEGGEGRVPNALSFTSEGSTGIDNGTYSSSTVPYIRSDSADKSTGIVFVSDGICWYIVGSYDTVGAAWESGNDSITPISMGSDNTKIFVQGAASVDEKHYYLPVPVSSQSQYFIIVKSRNQNQNLIYYANGPGQSGNTFNEEMGRIYRPGGGNGHYACYWFVSKRNGDYFKYYPVIAHYR